MTTYALVSENSPIRLWGLDSDQRLRRQLREISKESSDKCGVIRGLEDSENLPADSQILLINGNFLFENRTIRSLLECADSILLHSDDTVAAAFVSAEHAAQMLKHIRDRRETPPTGLRTIHTVDLEAFDENLRRATRPLLERISENRKTELENQLYGNAYRGITDLVTKFLWPKPAKHVVHMCADASISPNMVTSMGLLLVVAACYLFLHGYYTWGLLAGWIMTFLDTVDGKLARVTIQSSKFGHLFDHIIDLFHPPFWYIFWGMSLSNFEPVMGVGQDQMYWIIIVSYIAGRAVEGIFPILGNCSIFTWRPFDAWFRLITARRNPNLILLTMSALITSPEWGFIAVVIWSAFTSLVLVLRLVQAFILRLARGPLTSWLSENNVATGPNARSYAVFGATRGAYAQK